MEKALPTLAALALAAFASAAVRADASHEHAPAVRMPHSVEEMREMHRQHEHAHDFAAMERMSEEERERMFALMEEIGLALPPMDPARGRRLFLDRGCVACHAIDGVGGDVGPPLDADRMPHPMNVFEFAARMWRGAPAMLALQQELFGEPIALDGQDLADLVAFAHDEREQAKLRPEDVPERFRSLLDGE